MCKSKGMLGAPGAAAAAAATVDARAHLRANITTNVDGTGSTTTGATWRTSNVALCARITANPRASTEPVSSRIELGVYLVLRGRMDLYTSPPDPFSTKTNACRRPTRPVLLLLAEPAQLLFLCLWHHRPLPPQHVGPDDPPVLRRWCAPARLYMHVYALSVVLSPDRNNARITIHRQRAHNFGAMHAASLPPDGHGRADECDRLAP